MRKNKPIIMKLDPYMFSEKEREILASPSFCVSLFRYRTGVEALRIKIGRGEFIWLPYLGQQLWDWSIDGKSLKFEGFIEEPSYGKNFLQNYGGFLIHCGMTAMGNPGPEDTHLNHGELPIAKFDEAWIEMEPENDSESPVSLCGHIHWKVPFVAEYHCSPSLSISADGLQASMEVLLDNPASKTMEYMYLAHINFAFSGAEKILSTVPFDSSHVTIRADGEEKTAALFADPSLIKQIDKKAKYEPELVAILNHRDIASEAGSILLYEDGTARWVRQQKPELDHHVIWITHNEDRGACGFHLPSTAGPTGYSNEKNLGNLKHLPAGCNATLRYDFGFADRLEDVPIICTKSRLSNVG